MYQKVTLIGRLTSDPEISEINGVRLAKLVVVTSRNFQQNGEWKQESQFHIVKIWGDSVKSADTLKKGYLVLVEGELRYSKATGQDNIERYYTDIVGRVKKLSKPSTNTQATTQAVPQADPAEAFNAPDMNDEMPF